MTVYITTLFFTFLLTFVHGTDGHTLNMGDCEGFHSSLSSTELDLSSQNIPVLRAKCLKGFNKVKTLVLKNCKIEEIEPDAFNTLEDLVELDLSNNLLDHLPENLFQHNKKLEWVSLKNNKLTAAPNIAVPLVELDMSRNDISSLNLINNLDVQKLNIGFNRLESLSAQDLANLRKVVVININNNPWKCGPEFDEILCWGLKRTDEHSEKTPIKCNSVAGHVSYTIPRRQKLCDIQDEIARSQFSSLIVTEDETHFAYSGNSYSEVPVVENNNNKQEQPEIGGSTTSFPETKKMVLYKSRNSGMKEFLSESGDVKKWEVIAFIGWMCAAVALAVVAYIIYAFKLSVKPSYKRINDDNTSNCQVP